MSMAKVNNAFSRALGTKGASGGCAMVWERGSDGVQRQRLTCWVTLPNGTDTIATGLYDGQADLAAAAERLGAEFSGG